MKEEFKFLTVLNQDREPVSMFIDAKFSKVWVGKKAVYVKAGKSTKDEVEDGAYEFTDGRQLTIKSGEVESLKTRTEVLIEQTNDKLDMFASLMSEFLKTVQK